MSTEVRFEREGPLAIITLDGPKKRNALSAQSRSDLLAAMTRAMRYEPDVRAIVLTGAAGHFCAGADVSQFTRNTVARGRFNIKESGVIVREMMGGTKPVIAAVEGTAYGMGVSLAIAADFVVAARNARFCPVFARIGLVPDTGIFWTLPRRVGGAKARQLLARAQELEGQQALELGVASQVSEPGRALDDAKRLALALAAMPSSAVAQVKAALTFHCNSFEEALQAEVDGQTALSVDMAARPEVSRRLEVRRQDSLAIVTIKAPDVDGDVSKRLLTDLISTIRQLMDDDDTRAIVIASSDRSQIGIGTPAAGMAQGQVDTRWQLSDGAELAQLVWAGAKPVVVAAEGMAAGRGLALVALGDVAVAAKNVQFSCDFVRQGRMPEGGLLWTLAQKVGAGRAREILLSGQTLSSDEAFRIGLVHRLCEPGCALECAVEEASRLAQLPPVTLMLLKGALVSAMNSIPTAVRHEVDLNPLVRSTADHKEAVSAFLEKRKPQFRGE